MPICTVALITNLKYHNRTRTLLVPCRLTGRYQQWGGTTNLHSVEVETMDGRILWADPDTLREPDGELIEDLKLSLFLCSPGPVLDSTLLHYISVRHPDIFPWAAEF
jgi:hypothetical protein